MDAAAAQLGVKYGAVLGHMAEQGVMRISLDVSAIGSLAARRSAADVGGVEVERHPVAFFDTGQLERLLVDHSQSLVERGDVPDCKTPEKRTSGLGRGDGEPSQLLLNRIGAGYCQVFKAAGTKSDSLRDGKD